MQVATLRISRRTRRQSIFNIDKMLAELVRQYDLHVDTALGAELDELASLCGTTRYYGEPDASLRARVVAR